MADVITYDLLQVDCNIELKEIRGLTIHACPNEHAVATVDAILNVSQSGVIADKLSAQPISISTKGPNGKTLFYGVIAEALMGREADFVTLHIKAYSLSWLLDLEQKSRSFQRTDQNHTDVISGILTDYDADAIYNIPDKAIEKPYIQYQETDWEFIRRIASQLGAPIIPAMQLAYAGLYIGFPAKGGAETINSPIYRVGLDERYRQRPGGDRRQCIYYEVEEYTPRLIGDQVTFRGETLYVSAMNACLQKNVLYFMYRLAGLDYNKVMPIYNQALCGRNITGTVLDRKAELLRLHLEIDEEQNTDDAYFYPWLPETGNIMYDMPELETRVSLYMQNADEHSAICIQNIRDNGAACPLTQDQSQRFWSTELQKSLSLKPRTIDLAAMKAGDAALIDDNFGCQITSGKEVLIQACGNVSINGAKVYMRAPQEISTVRRNLGEPTVMNLCHNVDAIGGKGKFHATEKYLKPRKTKKGQLIASTYGSGEAQKMSKQEKRKKLKFTLAELQQQSDDEPKYDLSDVFQTVVAAVPQRTGGDQLARLSVGSRVLFGNKEDYMDVTISKEWGNREKPGYQSNQSVFTDKRSTSNIREDALPHSTNGNMRIRSVK